MLARPFLTTPTKSLKPSAWGGVFSSLSQLHPPSPVLPRINAAYTSLVHTDTLKDKPV